MSKAAVLVIDGVEEVECLTVVDFCRRAGIEVTTVSVTGSRQVKGSHDVIFHTDDVFADVNFDDFDAVVYPGGPGTAALGQAEALSPEGFIAFIAMFSQITRPVRDRKSVV